MMSAAVRCKSMVVSPFLYRIFNNGQAFLAHAHFGPVPGPVNCRTRLLRICN